MSDEIVIHDGNHQQHQSWAGPDGAVRAKGLVPRDYSKDPHGSLAFAPAFDIPLIPKNEWVDRLADRVAKRAQLSDIRNKSGPGGGPIPSRDQNGKGYCWAHSGVSAHLLCRAAMGEPYVSLSAYAVACMVKGFQDEGGWGAEGIEFESSKGCPSEQFWPQQSMSRSNDNPQTWADAAKHKYVQWRDLDPNQMVDQLVTCLLLGIPVVSDFNWWSHSVCTMQLESIDPNNPTSSIQTRIWNSWGDSWSENGTGKLQGRKAIPDGAWAALIISPSGD